MMGINTLINDKTEYIVDMLGRTGKLINIDNHYLFQPVEIENNNITMYQRKHPMSYKRKNLKFIIPDSFKEKKIKIKDIEKSNNKIKPIFEELTQKYKFLLDPQNIPIKFKDTWEFNAAWAIQNINKYNFIDKKQLIYYSMEHIIDVLNYNNKLILIKYLYEDKKDDSIDLNQSELISMVKSIFDKLIIESDQYKGIVIPNYASNLKYKYKIFTFNNGKLISDSKSIRYGLFQLYLKNLSIH